MCLGPGWLFVLITAEQTTKEGASSFGYWTPLLFGCSLFLIHIIVIKIALQILRCWSATSLHVSNAQETPRLNGNSPDRFGPERKS